MSDSIPSGKVQTVLGPIDADALGLTLTHEHLFTSMTHVAKEPAESEAQAAFHVPLSMDLMGPIRYGRLLNLDDCALNDVNAAIEEAAIFKREGGGTLVDVSSIGVGHSRQCSTSVLVLTKAHQAILPPAQQ